MKNLATFAFAVTIASLSSSATEVSVADCDAIKSVADSWHEVAKNVKVFQEGGLSDGELEQVLQKKLELAEVTGTMVGNLENGDPREKSLAEIIDSQFNGLDNAKPGDVAEKIERLVKSIDNVTEYCLEIAE